MSRKASRPNPFAFLTVKGMSHLLTTAAQQGQTNSDVLDRLRSWKKSDNINPEWIDESHVPTGEHYFTGAGFTEEELKQRFSQTISNLRSFAETVYEKQVKGQESAKRQISAKIAAGELTEEMIPANIREYLDRKIEMPEFPTLGRSSRSSTEEKELEMTRAMGIDPEVFAAMQALAGLSVVKVH